MSARKAMSLRGMRGISSSNRAEARGIESQEKPSRRSSLGNIMCALKTSVQRASEGIDRFERRLFAEYDQHRGIDNDNDAFGMLYAQRGQNQRAEFESRYRHLVETLGDLSLAADVDPGRAAALLNESGVARDLDAMLALLRAEERRKSRSDHSRIYGGGSRADVNIAGGGDLLAAPCLEFLLEERVVKVLCEMGGADRPAGTLALVLGAMASLLGQVSHPLLPSQAVHNPIAKLIAAAGTHARRLEGPGESGSVAIVKVQENLARLLGAIWRKLREESALLDFFLHTGEDGALRLDVFDRLLPLMELRGNVGQCAQEACLVALSVKDGRVGRHVCDRTGLPSQLAETLTARFMALYDTLEEVEVAAALPVWEGQEEAGAGGIADLLTRQQPKRAEEKFTEALTLYLQHLRFCNAVGLVAADTQACLRSPSALAAPSASGGDGCEGMGALAQPVGSNCDARKAGVEVGVATKLVAQVRCILLGNAVGPALSSALESRARWTTTIVARTITELSTGVEGYGVAVAGLAATAGERCAGRRQLGPLVDTISAFLVRREGPRSSGSESSPTSPVNGAEAAPRPTSTSMVVMTSRESRNVCLREVLLRRLNPCSPSQLRISTLDLLTSLAELRDDRVLLDLFLCPGSERRPSNNASGAGEIQGEMNSEAGGGLGEGGVEALLDAFPGGALEGLRVSRSMIESFGSAFSGSPIHPNFRLFSTSSKLGLEDYLVAAHQRQIHQLMEGARGGGREANVLDAVVGGTGGKVLQAVAAAAAAAAEAPSSKSNVSAMEGGGFVDFDAVEFARKHGEKLASATRGSFLDALFDCLEAMFERTLEENLAVTGVLSSICLAATAAEVSPVRRLLLLLLFDDTRDAPFRSVRRILEKLWTSAQERVDSLPDATRLLAQARLSLGIASDGDPAESAAVDGTAGIAGVVGIGGRARVGSGSQSSRGMREELSNSKRRQQQQIQQQTQGAAEASDGGGGWRALGGEATVPASDGGGVSSSAQQRRPQHREQQSPSSSHFLSTYVFLEEFLKELFCALTAKNGVETDTQGLSESHRQGSAELLRTRFLTVDGDGSPKQPAGSGTWGGSGDRCFERGAADGGDAEVGDLPTSLDEFLREAAFPTSVLPPLS